MTKNPLTPNSYHPQLLLLYIYTEWPDFQPLVFSLLCLSLWQWYEFTAIMNEDDVHASVMNRIEVRTYLLAEFVFIASTH